MKEETLRWQLEEDPSAADRLVISQGVVAFGRAQAVGGDPQPMGLFVRHQDHIVAGATGRSEFRRLFVDYLWVHESRRRRGLGEQVLAQFERAGWDRGCVDVLLETLSDENAIWYQRLGYRIVARIPAYVGWFTKYVMVKML